MAGVTGGLVAAIYGQRALKFSPKLSWGSGLVAGALSGYFFSQAFLSSYLSQLRQEMIRRNAAMLETLDDSKTPTT